MQASLSAYTSQAMRRTESLLAGDNDRNTRVLYAQEAHRQLCAKLPAEAQQRLHHSDELRSSLLIAYRTKLWDSCSSVQSLLMSKISVAI